MNSSINVNVYTTPRPEDTGHFLHSTKLLLLWPNKISIHHSELCCQEFCVHCFGTHICGIKYHVALCLDSFLNIMSVGFTYVVTVICFCWVLSNAVLIFYNLLALSTTGGYLGYFIIGVFTNKTNRKQLMYLPSGGHKTHLFWIYSLHIHSCNHL